MFTYLYLINHKGKYDLGSNSTNYKDPCQPIK